LTVENMAKNSDAVSVGLTEHEMFVAATVGITRMLKVIKEGRNHTYGSTDKDNWQRHIEGAFGECAVAKYLKIFWMGGRFDKIGGPDVGIYEVRTADKEYKRLILHPEDKDDSLFIFVTGLHGKYRLRGWIKCSEGKLDRFWEDPKHENRWAYFVPTSVLNPISTFPLFNKEINNDTGLVRSSIKESIVAVH